MPYTFKKTPMAYKDPTSEDYLPIELLSDGELPQKVAAVENSIAPNYDDLTFPVSEGEACMYNGSRYVANQNISTTEVWTAAHWTLSPVSAEISSLSNALTQSTENTNIAISAHPVGGLFWYNGTLHVATSAIAVGDTIVDTGTGVNCKDTTISEALIKDIQVNGVSILQNGVANVPIASSSTPGVMKVNNKGVKIDNGELAIRGAGSAVLKEGTTDSFVVTPWGQHQSVFYGLTKAAGADMANVSNTTVGVYPEAQKSAISQMLDAPENVSGTIVSITGKAGIRYICGTVSEITITPPASGGIDVLFTAGSNCVLSIPNTVKFPSWFDPSSLVAGVAYEINILDGVYGAVSAWA